MKYDHGRPRFYKNRAHAMRTPPPPLMQQARNIYSARNTGGSPNSATFGQGTE